MNRFTENIDKQIEFNQDKNIFLENLEMFQFANETIEAISNIEGLNHNSKKILIDYTTDKAIGAFCRVNQYYSFDSKAKDDLRKIYSDLMDSFQTKTNSVENISKNHYESLKRWLKKSNPFAEKIYLTAGKKISPVACSEYSPDFQFNMLKIDIKHLMQPVLDIGCGRHGHLVNHLKNNGIEVCGIDRFKFTTPDLITTDWLEFNYGTEKWGTIISNLGYSNHFVHHNLREDGNYIGYARKYMEILNSLKKGGKFHYAPDLPFIETYLDKDNFKIENFKIGEIRFKTSIITRLK